MGQSDGVENGSLSWLNEISAREKSLADIVGNFE